MRRLGTIGARICSLCGIMLLLAIAGSMDASAQRWQWIYGGPEKEAGRGGVRPVAEGGYIAAGESFTPSGGGTSDILVVRTNDDGSLAWMQTYDINGNDSVTDIEEVTMDERGGFIICGVTDNNRCEGNRDAFLLRIDRCGEVLWVNTYGTPKTQEIAWDVIVANFGDPLCGTQPGDFVVAGSSGPAGGPVDGYLFRAANAAPPNLIWGRTYNGPCDRNDYFYGLTETSTGAQNGERGDIVAVGGTNSWCDPAFGRIDAFIVRVKGCDGELDNTGALGAAVYGGKWVEELRSVAEITIDNNCLGNLVYIGHTDVPNPIGAVRPEVYLLQTTANPCKKVSDLTIGERDEDEGYCIREVPAGHPDAGMVVATGYMTLPANLGGKDVFVQRFDPCNFGIIAPFTRLIGGAGTDWGWSVHPVTESLPCRTAGYVVAGVSDSWSDQQLYLIKTDINLRAGCHDTEWEPLRDHPNYEWICVEPKIMVVERECQPGIAAECQTWHDRLCYDDEGTQICIIDGCPCGMMKRSAPGEATISLDGAGSFRSYPNPVTRGGAITLEYTMVREGNVSVTITDLAGREVYTRTRSLKGGMHTMPVETEGWSIGTYLVRLSIDGRSSTTQVMVTENK